MIEGMLPLYSKYIDEILTSYDGCAQRAVMLLDRYDCADAQDEFVAALIHRLLVEQSRNRTAIPTDPSADREPGEVD
jgi:hypothetical protein